MDLTGDMGLLRFGLSAVGVNLVKVGDDLVRMVVVVR